MKRHTSTKTDANALVSSGGGRLAPLLSIAFAAFVAIMAGDAATSQTFASSTNAAQTANHAKPATFNIAEPRGFFNFNALIVDSANNNSEAFNNFYQNAQLRALSALDAALAAKATDAIAGYDSIKSAGINFQTALGGRDAQVGIDIIGAIKDNEERRYGIGWQLRVYAAEGESKGANGGVFFRRIQNNILYGVNLFADYQNHDRGDFYRYGIGGEVKDENAEFIANYYAPLTGDIRKGDIVAYSREGFDANLRISIPGARFMKAEAAYYHFDGKHDTAAQKGFRYGAALSPADNIVIRGFYDDGGEEFGGDIAYAWTIGREQQNNNANNFNPDLFAPVLREHSQRIAMVTVAAPTMTAPRITGNFDVYHSSVFVTAFFGTVGTVMASGGEGGYSYTSSDSAFVVDNDGAVRFRTNATGTVSAVITIDDNDAQTLPVSVTLTAIAVPRCSFIRGCVALGHFASNSPPPLQLATMLVNAGANVNSEIRLDNGGNSLGMHGIISRYVELRASGGSSDQAVVNIISFLLDHGADINYQHTGGTGNLNGQTALDSYNGNLGSSSPSIATALRNNGARCNAQCRDGDTKIDGEMCNQDTTRPEQSCRM